MARTRFYEKRETYPWSKHYTNSEYPWIADYSTSGSLSPLDVYHKIQDNVNQKPYPESLCNHVRCTIGSRYQREFYYKSWQQISTLSYAPVDAKYFADNFISLNASRTTEAIELARDYILSTKGKVVDEWSLIENIVELGSIPGLVKKITKYRYLDYSFGVAPLVQDLTSLLNNLTHARSRLQKIQKGFREKFSLRRDIILELPKFTNASNGHHQCPCVVKFDTIVSQAIASGWFDISLPIMSDTERYARLVLDIIGFHPDLATLWELVPMSFLVDWFIPVGDFLDTINSRGWIKPVLKIGPASTSFRYFGNFRTFGGFQPASTTQAAYCSTVLSNVGTLRYYDRRVFNGLVPEVYSPDFPDYIDGRFTQGRALVIADLIRAQVEDHIVGHPKMQSKLWKKIF
jgi:hypothetical protein